MLALSQANESKSQRGMMRIQSEAAAVSSNHKLDVVI
jgi:hypothetical protein